MLGLRLAQRIGGEIVNADAMQLYRGMDIGTAKLPSDERAGIPHHLLDIWDVTQRASVVDFQQQAVALVTELVARGVPAVVVGGSGLYVRALLDDLRIPPTDPLIRAELEAQLAADGPASLHSRLAVLDPAAAQAILPSNGRRLVRALEVVALTGSYTATLPAGRYRWGECVQIGVDADDLDARIAVRVRRMFVGGLVREALSLPGLARSPTASKALGYAQVLADPSDPDAASEATVVATRRYARRQRSWFRRDPRIRWVDGEAAALAAIA